MRAVLLGGGKCNVALASITQEKYKARVKLRNKSMIDYTIEALLQSKSIDSIDVYTEKEITNEIPIDKSIKVYYSKKSPIENILDFIYKNSETLKNTSFLICTSDLPLLKSETIDEFIKLAVESKRKFVMPLVHKKEIIKKFPSIKRTYLTINKQEWCGGNIFLSEKDFFLRNAELAKLLFSHRKSILKSGKIFGWRVLVKLFLKKLSFDFIEKDSKKRLGDSVLTLVFNHVEVAIDVDKPSDYTILSKYLEKKDF